MSCYVYELTSTDKKFSFFNNVELQHGCRK